MLVDFQAVVLAGGKGVSLFPLTQDTPKCLLQVNDKPLLWYQLNFLENSSFENTVTVVTSESSHDAVRSYIEGYATDSSLTIEIATVHGDDIDTVDALWQIREKIKSLHFFVISGDLVIEPEPSPQMVLHTLADLHRIEDSSVTMLLREERKSIHKKERTKREADCFGFDPAQRRVLLLNPAFHLEDEVMIPKALLQSQPDIRTRTDLTDMHLYAFSRHMIELLHAKKTLLNIKADLIPYLVRRQFRGPDSLPEDFIRYLEGQDNIVVRTLDDKSDDKNLIRCFAHVKKSGSLYCERADTTASYEAICKRIKPRR